jgi:hypothetical protein
MAQLVSSGFDATLTQAANAINTIPNYSILSLGNSQAGFQSFRADRGTLPFIPGQQNALKGNFINFSFTADGFAIGLNGSLQMIPEVAKITAIITGILGIFGLLSGQSAGDPIPLPKVITADAGISIGSLIGATNGIQALINLLQGTVNAWKGAIQRAITSIQNLFKCLLKNPLLAFAILAKILRQLGLTMPPGLLAVLQALKELLTKAFTFVIDIALPADILAFIKKLLSFKIPPFLLLPFIPEIPGCSPAFYSGRPPVTASYGTIVTPQPNNGLGITSSAVSTQIQTGYTVLTGVGSAPTLATTKTVLTLSGYAATDPSFFQPQTLDQSTLAPSNLTTSLAPANSQIRQAQDALISSGNTFTTTVAVMQKDVSRVGILPRTSPLDDLLCAPNQLVNR